MIKLSRLDFCFLGGQKHLRQLCSKQTWEEPKGIDTGIKVYNCIDRKKVPIILSTNVATWYTCGPTVYDSSHIGHASNYVKIDIIQRILREYFNINLVTAMNITDVDDKIIKRSNETSKTCQSITTQFEREFWEDMNNLGIQEPDIKLRVTDNIQLIVKFIEGIVKKGSGYVGNDGSVYFDIKTYASYGKLQKINVEEKDHKDKNLSADFALWKAKKGNEPYWDSPWGPGRPGWHIECSALASKVFGNKIDFHAGGIDLRFPHHENEETQSCSFFNCPQWVNYWIHTGMLTVKGQADKMSKSLKNTIGIKEMLKDNSKDDFRMACLLSNYRNSMEYSSEMMETAKNTLAKFLSFDADCEAFVEGKKTRTQIDSGMILRKTNELNEAIRLELTDDFNTAKCISHLLDLMKLVSHEINNKESTINNCTFSSTDLLTVIASKNAVQRILKMFGLFRDENKYTTSDGAKLNVIMSDLVLLRKNLRDIAKSTKNKEMFKICDDVRDRLIANGVELIDHQNDTSWKFVK